MSKVEDFLTATEEQEVIAAIREAELKTSGEIRVHLEKSTGGLDPYQRATTLFHELKMDNTKQGNGVLIYVAVEDNNFVICGDRGIDHVVPNNFWESTKDIMQSRFKEGRFKRGLIDGVLKAGEQLQKHFPWEIGDKDELSNEISKG